MIPVTDLRNGTTFKQDGTPFVVLKYAHIKMGRGSATIRVTVRNMRTSSVEEKTFNSGGTVEPIVTTKRQLQYLYTDSSNTVFMDPKTFEQMEVAKNILGERAHFLREGQVVDVLFWSQEDSSAALDVSLPPNVVLSVVQTDPGLKGNSATNVYKPATLENGLTVKVPLFIKIGDKVKVDTRSGEYVERAQ